MTSLDNTLTQALIFITLFLSLTAIYVSLRTYLNLRTFTKVLSSKTLKTYINKLESKKKLRKRYLIVRLVSTRKHTHKELQELLEKYYTHLHGKISLSKAQPKIVYIDFKNNTLIVRFRAPFKWSVISSLAMLEVNKHVDAVIPLKTTSTLKKAKKYAIPVSD